MKIIQLIYSLASGGAERFVVNLSNQLAAMGHEVHICMLLSDQVSRNTFNRQYVNKSVNVHSLGFDKGFSIKKSNIVQNYILNLDPDVVHCHLNVIPYVFRLSLVNKSIKFVHTLHNVANNASGKWWQRSINRFFYTYKFIQPITISKVCDESYQKFYHLNNSICIENGSIPPITTLDYENVKREVDKYKKNDNTLVFLHVARYHEQKNQKLLIDSFNQLSLQELNYTLLVLGEGFDAPGADQLKDSASENIHFLGVKSNVVDYLMCADAFCLTSIYEGLPISLLEALACGVIPVCTAVGGIPDVITDGLNGYLSECSIQSYVNAIKRFLDGNISRDKLISHFNKRFSISVCAENYVKAYEDK